MVRKSREEARSLIAEHLRSHPKDGYRKVADAVGCSVDVAMSVLREIRSGKAPIGTVPSEAETHEHTKDTWRIVNPKTTITSVEDLVDYYKIDLKLWEVVSLKVGSWEMGSVDKDRNPQVTPLHRIEATLKRRHEMVNLLAEIGELKSEAKTFFKPFKLTPGPRKVSDSGVMVEVSIPDLHIGKLAWSKETGYTNYDSNEAERLFMDAVSVIVKRVHIHNPERIVFVLGNDLLNSDNIEGTTTKGTQQHNDSRYHKMFKAGRRMAAEAIRQLYAMAPVDTILVPGNHDRLAAWHLGDTLEVLFDGNQHITIENSPAPRKYYQWHRVMLGFTHGDKGKHADYPLLFATERRDMFGSTTWREIHVGHLHQTNVREKNGVRVRILPALCAPDAWHAENGYVGNIRSAEAFVWSPDELLGTVLYTPPDYAEIAA